MGGSAASSASRSSPSAGRCSQFRIPHREHPTPHSPRAETTDRTEDTPGLDAPTAQVSAAEERLKRTVRPLNPSRGKPAGALRAGACARRRESRKQEVIASSLGSALMSGAAKGYFDPPRCFLVRVFILNTSPSGTHCPPGRWGCGTAAGPARDVSQQAPLTHLYQPEPGLRLMPKSQVQKHSIAYIVGGTVILLSIRHLSLL